jgi:hypothetical protein
VSFDQSVIHVPVMLKVNVGSESRNGLSFLVLGGGYFEWQFNSKLTSGSSTIDLSNGTNGYEVGFTLGAGVEIARFSVQGRYIRGLRQIDRTFNLGESTKSDSQAFAVLLGFRLN